jgi:hypothetical protein
LSEKNWLIRTKHNQIHGPISKQKVIELIEKGSLSKDDEVVSGNGYWFSVKEQDLVEKYLFGDIPQSFNPISEAEDVLTAQSNGSNTSSFNRVTDHIKEDEPEVNKDGSAQIPDVEDLEYPDMGFADNEEDGVTQVFDQSGLSLTEEELAESEEIEEDTSPTQDLSPEQTDEHEEEYEEDEGEYEEEDEEEEYEEYEEDDEESKVNSEKLKKKRNAKKEKFVPPRKRAKPISNRQGNRNDKLFLIVGIILFLGTLIGALYYYNNILNDSLSYRGPFSSFGIESVYAQEVDTSLSKKKSL